MLRAESSRSLWPGSRPHPLICGGAPPMSHEWLSGFGIGERNLKPGPAALPIADQEQQPPPQQPPPLVGAGAATAGAAARPVVAKVVSSFTVSSCPPGQTAGSDACVIGRFTAKVLPQLRHRNS